ncbi:TetR/AcrR family transcriptional regulator [Hyalangium minutum]|uniref:Transcriptional regulator, TetR family protein n=1 Tax=Hyalangium minutum TaxID=394096 RepID=A0A085WSY1_9BACT|nr:TetR/AcrR family transcriptional regulator [Hyalangium minutum]KFE70794.1 Transcriptional regulator, TetR family protein [Hyalangium minutum]
MAARKKTSSQSKPSYHHGDLRRALIEASLALISEKGFSALTLREVARRAGVTHAAPYRHFADKEALLAAVAEEGFRSMASEMRERMDTETRPTERLLACGVAYVLFAVRHPAHFRVMFGPHFNKPSDHEEMSKEGTHSFGLLMQSIIQGQQAGELRQGEPLPLALMVCSQVHGLASLLVDHQLDRPGEDTPDAEQIAIFQTRLLFEGLRRPAQNV